MAESAHIPSASTVDPAEIQRFSRIADEWWDPAGKFAPLHRLNPVRLGYIRDRAAQHWQRNARPPPRGGLWVLDMGWGGGLLGEPMARLGAEVTGIDAAERNVAIARRHAENVGVRVTYLPCAAENLAAQIDTSENGRFDAVLAMEIVEHVA